MGNVDLSKVLNRSTNPVIVGDAHMYPLLTYQAEPEDEEDEAVYHPEEDSLRHPRLAAGPCRFLKPNQ